MKNSALLTLTLILIFPRVGFADEGQNPDNFNAYVNNSPEGSVQNPVDKTIDLNDVKKHEVRKDSGIPDTKTGPQVIPAQWKACSMDSDCTAGVIDCVSWEPLNKKYVRKLSKSLNSCVASIDPGFQPESVCVAKECKTTEKSTNVSWEEWFGEMRKRKDQPAEIK